eukprot:CAMPEP_0206480804 /NCGR_PEP_ID=MMETSP0324_2-20121206/37666_1 /ASSEMBLY_ACC=CAM_ASM_000836 /TAXON_ID=2866 /ORGANISM="Crypthecodinium cohnii, Strain Seligo" /LENGTH=67 /DNA_ID=CAMNT_0053957969 /DNA_START=82 /DNA_END=285 /DNA_ORIENTATION=+
MPGVVVLESRTVADANSDSSKQSSKMQLQSAGLTLLRQDSSTFCRFRSVSSSQSLFLCRPAPNTSNA